MMQDKDEEAIQYSDNEDGVENDEAMDDAED